MTDTEEETAPPASTPQDEISRSCTRQTQCKKANCPGCSVTITGNRHVRDLSQDLETTPPPKKHPKPPAPPNHIISSITAELQQACLDNNLEDIMIFLDQAELYRKISLDLLKYDCSELAEALKTARQLHKGPEDSQPAPAPTTHHPLHPPDLQTISMKMPRVEVTKWNGLSYDFYPWIAANAKMFQQSKWDDAAKTQGMLQTMPIDKQSSFVHIDNWE